MNNSIETKKYSRLSIITASFALLFYAILFSVAWMYSRYSHSELIRNFTFGFTFPEENINVYLVSRGCDFLEKCEGVGKLQIAHQIAHYSYWLFLIFGSLFILFFILWIFGAMYNKVIRNNNRDVKP